jgi:hypothetical protein
MGTNHVRNAQRYNYISIRVRGCIPQHFNKFIASAHLTEFLNVHGAYLSSLILLSVFRLLQHVLPLAATMLLVRTSLPLVRSFSVSPVNAMNLCA